MKPCDECGIALIAQKTWTKMPTVERDVYRKAKTLAPIASRHPYRLCKRCWTADKRRRKNERTEAASSRRNAEMAVTWETVVVGGITYWKKPTETRAEFEARVNKRKRVMA